MIPELNKIECISVFVEDLSVAKNFYESVFGRKALLEDAHSAVIPLDNVMLNLLIISQAGELITPTKVADRASGCRMMFTIKVPNVDEVCAKLAQHGVTLLNGPTDRWWGRRTAAFADPAGNAWEIAHDLKG